MPNLKIFWDSVQNAVTYNIYYSTTPGVTIENGTLISGIQDVVYYHTGLNDNTPYYYIIVAVDAQGNLGTPSMEFGATSSTVSEFVILPTNIVTFAGETQQYTAQIIYSSGNIVDVTSSTLWDTDNYSVATIDSNGLATAISIGTVNIIGTYNSFISSAPLNVQNVLLSIEITPSSSPTVDVNSTLQFTAIGHYSDLTTSDITNLVTWSSSISSHATIDGYGLATGIFHGTTNIGASLGLVSATAITLNVIAILNSISITPNISPSVNVGNTIQFTAIGNYNDTSTLDLTSISVWNSSDNTKATINSNGLATGIFHGSTNISTTYNFITSNIVALNVVAMLTSISISPQNPTVNFPTTTQQFTATGHYNDASTLDLTNIATWSSSVPANTTIDAYGLATIVADGYSIITASYDAYSANTGITGTAVGATLVHWVKADAGVTKNISDVVSLWSDQSGHGTDWGTPTGGNITWIDNQLNSLPVLRSPGGTGGGAPYLQQSRFMTNSTNSPGEVFVVLKSTGSLPVYSWAGFSTDGNSSHYPYSDGHIYDNFGSTSRPSTTSAYTSQTQSYGIFNISNGASSGNFVMRLNGTQIYSGGPFNSGWASTFRLFASNTAAPAGYGFNGDIGEILIFNNVLAPTNRTTVYNYLIDRWFATSPDNLSGLMHWVHTSAGVQTDMDGYVTAWLDQSGNNTDWTTETTVKPQLITNAQNGLGVIRTINFNDNTGATIQRMTQSPFFSGSNVAEAFIVIKSNGPGSYGSPYQWAWGSFGTQTDFIGHYGYGTSIYETFGANARVQLASSPQVTSYGVFNLTRDTTTLRGTLNGVVLDTQTVGIFWDSTFKLFNFPDAKINEYRTSYSYNIQFNGDIGEIIMYNRVLTSNERQRIHNYLARKWNISTPTP